MKRATVTVSWAICRCASGVCARKAGEEPEDVAVFGHRGRECRVHRRLCRRLQDERPVTLGETLQVIVVGHPDILSPVQQDRSVAQNLLLHLIEPGDWRLALAAGAVRPTRRCPARG